MKKAYAFLLVVTLLFALGLSAVAEGSGISLTTGLPTDKEYKPMVVSFDNETKSRPQQGMAQADVIYEIELYNGGYTRYMAVFNDVIPSYIEAVRSIRISTVDVYLDWRGGLVFWGGQNYEGRDVFAYINKVKPDAYWNGMQHKNFGRNNKREAPNNVYAYLDKVMESKDFSVEPRSPFLFSADNPSIKGDEASFIDLQYRGDTYHPSFDYRDGLYYRNYNGKPHADRETGEQLTFSNVIVMRVETSWHQGMSDAPVHKLTGSNQCEFFIGGKHFTGTWSRASVNESTQYFDGEGNPVYLVPGKTFVEMAKDKVELTYR